MACCEAEFCDGRCALQSVPTALYILSDGYVGITPDPPGRLVKHRRKRGLVYMTVMQWYPNRSDALRAEAIWHDRFPDAAH